MRDDRADFLCTHVVMMSNTYFTLSAQLRQLWISKHAMPLRHTDHTDHWHGAQYQPLTAVVCLLAAGK